MDLEFLIALTCVAVMVWIVTMLGGIAVSVYTLWKS